MKTNTADLAPTPAAAPRPAAGDGKGSWKDIVVVPRKSVLKRRRVELMPMYSVTLNDNLIQHHSIGGEVNYFLTDILSIGVSGMYYFKNVLDQEFYTRYHFSRVPSLNKYTYTTALNFAYVPIYGKFTLLNRSIMHYEVFATAGVGISGTEVIPRDYTYAPFKNNLTLTFPVGAGARFFVTRWMAIQAAFRDYLMLDKFEPATRGPLTDNTAAARDKEASDAKSRAESSLVNNMMFTIGVSFFLPTDFKYTTFR